MLGELGYEDGCRESLGYTVVTQSHYLCSCRYHGHRPCPLVECKGIDRLTGHSFAQLRGATTDKIRKMKQMGFTVHSIYECEWQEQKKRNRHLQEYCDGLDLVGRLVPRDGFMGVSLNDCEKKTKKRVIHVMGDNWGEIGLHTCTCFVPTGEDRVSCHLCQERTTH